MDQVIPDQQQKYPSLFPQGDDLEILQKWIQLATGMPVDKQQFSKRPLYKATDDFWTGSDFHQRTYNKENTIILIKDKKSQQIFGGFTSKKWQSDKKNAENVYVQDPQSFLFNLQKKAMFQCIPVYQSKNEEEYQYEGGGITQNYVHGFYFLQETCQFMWQLRNEVYILNDPEIVNTGFNNKIAFSKAILDEQVYSEEFSTKWKNKIQDPVKGTDYVEVQVEEIEVYQILPKQ